MVVISELASTSCKEDAAKEIVVRLVMILQLLVEEHSVATQDKEIKVGIKEEDHKVVVTKVIIETTTVVLEEEEDIPEEEVISVEETTLPEEMALMEVTVSIKTTMAAAFKAAADLETILKAVSEIVVAKATLLKTISRIWEDLAVLSPVVALQRPEEDPSAIILEKETAKTTHASKHFNNMPSCYTILSSFSPTYKILNQIS